MCTGNARPIPQVDRQRAFEAGHALVPDRPGLGCELDEAAVERYAVSAG
ncbi:MAG: hypothetical protein ACRDI2_19565 [Chloroflexota bacterium]